jgi:hypothetical protein
VLCQIVLCWVGSDHDELGLVWLCEVELDWVGSGRAESSVSGLGLIRVMSVFSLWSKF